jgi:hypothetical protein
MTMKKFHLFCGLIIFGCLTHQAHSQKVTVSKEINVRNNLAYDILPNVGDHIIFYHDKGSEHTFEIYDQNMRFKREVQPEFEKKMIQPIGVTSTDSTVLFYYAFREGSELLTKAIIFDKNIAIKDSVTLSVKDKKLLNASTRIVFSKDKSKTLLFTPNEKFLQLQLIDNLNLKVLQDFKLIVDGVNLKTDFEKIHLTNNGEIFIMTQEKSMWKSEENKGFKIIHIISTAEILVTHFKTEYDEITQILIDYDEKNKQISMAGFVSDGNEATATGYFGFSVDPKSLPEEAEILINKFSIDFISEATGKTNKKQKQLNDYVLKNMVIRNDGGVILIAEMTKEFMRRSQMAAPGQFGNNMPLRGFIDYYNEDLILIANYPDGKEHWKKILFKKQFSQDDSGIYSSFYIFQNPSRLRIIYNDEIKNNNTVSEYVIDPIGNFERKSVLSTDYQNLRLRFRDAIQTGPNTLIVPSEKSFKINMVKIEYGL